MGLWLWNFEYYETIDSLVVKGMLKLKTFRESNKSVIVIQGIRWHTTINRLSKGALIINIEFDYMMVLSFDLL